VKCGRVVTTATLPILAAAMEKPADLIFGLDERPPLASWIALGFQNVAVMCPYLVLVALVVEAARLPADRAVGFMSMAMLGIAIYTLLQATRRGPIGSGYLCPPVVSAIYLSACLVAAAKGGMPLVAGMILVAGLAECGLARIVGRLRKIFPAVVSGIILMAVGLDLARIGMRIAWSPDLPGSPEFGGVEITFGVTLVTMVALSVWGRGPLRVFCALIGIVAGYIVAAFFGQLKPDFFAGLHDSAVFALPLTFPLGVTFDTGLVLPFVIAAVASGLRTVGTLTTCQQINDATWTRPDMKSISGGVTADGIGCAIGGLFSAPGLSASPSLVGIQKATGVTSRWVAWSIALWLVVLACLPKLASLIVHMPKPVMAGALFFNGTFMFVGGIQVALSRPLALRGTFLVGVPVLCAVGVLLYPEFFHRLPSWAQPITQSPISVATSIAILLNLLFLLGRWRYSGVQIELHDRKVSRSQLEQFIVSEGKAWKLPAADTARISAVVGDLLDQIATDGQAEDSIAVRAGWDGYDVTISLRYPGALPHVTDARPRRDYVEEQAFISGLSGYLSGIHADRVESFAKDGQCELKLTFRV
jgi:xanthine permease XanP